MSKWKSPLWILFLQIEIEIFWQIHGHPKVFASIKLKFCLLTDHPPLSTSPAPRRAPILMPGVKGAGAGRGTGAEEDCSDWRRRIKEHRRKERRKEVYGEKDILGILMLLSINLFSFLDPYYSIPNQALIVLMVIIFRF